MAFTVVGRFAVAVNGQPLEDHAVGSAKVRRLLALLVIGRGHFVSTDRIVAALWESEPSERAAENVATLVIRLRRVLGQGVVRGARGSYRLGDGAGMWIDLDAAEDLANRAEEGMRTAPAVSLAAARRALDLVGAGDLLENKTDAEWTILPRVQFGRLVRRVRHLYAEAALDVGEFEAAQRLSGATSRSGQAVRMDSCRLVTSGPAAASTTARYVSSAGAFTERSSSAGSRDDHSGQSANTGIGAHRNAGDRVHALTQPAG